MYNRFMEMEERLLAEIANNKPSDRARRLLSEMVTVLMVGASGSGRDTIIRALVDKGGYWPLLTSTTRPMRINNGVMESDGVEYNFLTEELAIDHLRAGDYLEVSPVHGHINGLLVDELQRAHDSGKIAITDMDPQGADKYMKLSDKVISIFMLPPSYEVWLSRLRQRYESDEAFEAAWPRRRQSADMELEMALNVPYYHFVINDDIFETTRICDQIAMGEGLSADLQQRGVVLARELLNRLRLE